MWGWFRFDRMSFLQLSVCVRARFCFCFFLRLYARVLVHDLQYTKDQFLIAVYFHLAFLFLVCQRSIPLMKSATRKPRFDKVRSRISDDPHLRLVRIFFLPHSNSACCRLPPCSPYILGAERSRLHPPSRTISLFARKLRGYRDTSFCGSRYESDLTWTRWPLAPRITCHLTTLTYSQSLFVDPLSIWRSVS